jgi:hypothetical protein
MQLLPSVGQNHQDRRLALRPHAKLHPARAGATLSPENRFTA